MILEFKNIVKSYNQVEALKDISFSIPENSIFGILGANGSGKSTFMKILPGLIYDWSGKIFYKEKLIQKNDMILKQEFGYLIEAPTFYEYLSAKKNLEILEIEQDQMRKKDDTDTKLLDGGYIPKVELEESENQYRIKLAID